MSTTTISHKLLNGVQLGNDYFMNENSIYQSEGGVYDSSRKIYRWDT